jgi:phosphotriesterase-related protein
LTPGVERVMRAVAKAHRRTGVPITVHTHPGSAAGVHVNRVMCDEEGVRPDRIDPNLMAALPQWHYLHIENDVLPYVRERGVTENMISEMLVEVPRRYFENASAY